MGIKGRRRAANTGAYETDPNAAYLQEKKQQSSPEEQQCPSSSSSSSTRPTVVSLLKKKRKGVVLAVVRYSDGSRYEGQTNGGAGDAAGDASRLRHGRGVYVTHNGHIFDGEWVHGVFQG